MQPLRVLLLGEAPVQSSPLRTLSLALSAVGLKTSVSPGVQRYSAVECAQFGRLFDALVFVHYDDISAFAYRQYAIARASGTPLIRWWVGTDVLNCLTDDPSRRSAQQLDKLVDDNIAVAPHLVDELKDSGISARFIPSVVRDLATPRVTEGTLPQQVLIYLPSHRWEFYHGPLMEQVVAANPGIAFIVVADVEHRLARFPNVKSLGWVEDMDAVLDTVGTLLRITQHDGLPRMAIECLLRGRYVIYSWELAGCHLAKSLCDINSAVRRFSAASAHNGPGREAALELMTPNPAESFARRIAVAAGNTAYKRQIRAVIGACGCACAYATRRMVGVLGRVRGPAMAGASTK